MKYLQPIITSLISFILGGGLVILITVNATHRQANTTAESAEIATLVQRIDAYDKIIHNLNQNLSFYVEKSFSYMTENEDLKQEVVVLRSEVQRLKLQVSKLEKNIAVHETL